jgi:mannitol 2-dehydrogenase
MAELVTAAARAQRLHPTAFIENAGLFGDLARQPRFVEAYRQALDSLHARGARATLDWLLNGTGG